jgi:SAM-dependent methyltransferase
MMTSARQVYIDTIDAVEAQRRRLGLGGPEGGARWDNAAARFTDDPRREPEANLRAILEYIRPDHVVLDVGGGAGRYALPIALRCKEVVNVEPSRGMGEAFEASARAAGITNARWAGADWLSAGTVEGDVSLVVNVTYFVRDAVPFVQKLIEASSQRVIIAMSVTPPPNQSAHVFELVHGEPQALVPGYRELLPVLWEMGVVPDVRVLSEFRATALGDVYPDRDAALDSLNDPRRSESESARLRGLFETHFDALFEARAGGFRRRPAGDARMILLTWSTRTA